MKKTKRNKWTNEEIKLLKKSYEKGVPEILLTNHTKNSIKKKAYRLKLSVDKDKMNFNFDEISKAVKESYSFAEVFRKLNKSKSGDSYKVLKSYIERNNIDYSHFNPYKNNRINGKKYPLSHWLQKGSNINSSKLKEKLYDNGLKERKCEKCGQDENWYGKHMSLILDHINGINDDNRLENLRILCPNCNATLPTHCGKNLKKKKQVYYCKCGKEKSRGAEKCLDCYNKLTRQRKAKRPNYEQLINEINELGYSGTGRKYGVSDNAIRKWKKKYEKYS